MFELRSNRPIYVIGAVGLAIGAFVAFLLGALVFHILRGGPGVKEIRQEFARIGQPEGTVATIHDQQDIRDLDNRPFIDYDVTWPGSVNQFMAEMDRRMRAAGYTRSPASYTNELGGAATFWGSDAYRFQFYCQPHGADVGCAVTASAN